jgi:hypothetical protein
MNRLLLLTLAVLCSCTATTSADDYLLRVDTTGYTDVPASEKAPKETVLRSIEAVARPGAPFHAKVTLPSQTILLSGTLHPAKDGIFSVDIRYAHSVPKGDSIPTKDGGREPRFNTTEAETTIGAILGKPVILGGIQTETQQAGPGKKRLKSTTWYVLLLTKYEPTDG